MTRGDLTARLALRYTIEEEAMLRELAEADRTTVSDALRRLVRDAYGRRFGQKRPGADAEPTVRGIACDVAGPVHYTAGNIAKRTALPLKTVLGVLERLARVRLVERIDGSGAGSTWVPLVEGGREKLLERIERAGIPLDESLHDA
jgi:hypothetical protein